MYSTKLKDERFIVECITMLKRVRTGAKFTCCNYIELDKSLQEE